MPPMYDLFKSIAFTLDAEYAHEKTIWLAKNFPFISKGFCSDDLIDTQKYAIKVGPLKWCFPVGLAAGLDKNGEAINFFSGLKFGAIEVGTVTPKAQYGNNKPRLFRYPVDESLRNRLGFNNKGMDELFKNVIKARSEKCIGVNLGKNKTTPNEQAFVDYQTLYNKFASICDYMVVNVSSPNTPGLRDLQQKDSLEKILKGLVKLRSERSCPLFVKTSPDMANEDLLDVISLAQEYKLTGLISTNTTRVPEMGDGGVSGKLLYKKAKESREFILENLSGSGLELIGVGGFSSFEDIWDFWLKGGKAVQIYTGFIYQGPNILEEIKDGIDRKLKEHDCRTLNELFVKMHRESAN